MVVCPFTAPYSIKYTILNAIKATGNEFKVNGQIEKVRQKERFCKAALQDNLTKPKERVLSQWNTGSCYPVFATKLNFRKLLEAQWWAHSCATERNCGTITMNNLQKNYLKSCVTSPNCPKRALDLRQRVNSTERESKENGENISYRLHLVQKVFLHTVRTGSNSESVRHELRYPLQKQRQWPRSYTRNGSRVEMGQGLKQKDHNVYDSSVQRLLAMNLRPQMRKRRLRNRRTGS